MKKQVIIVLAIAQLLTLTNASDVDCWDFEQLRRMTFGNNQNKGSGLTKFSKVLKCLEMKKGGNIDGKSNFHDFNQWANNNNNNPRKNQYGPNWNNPGQKNREPVNNWDSGSLPGQVGPVPQQPQPGIHPDDLSHRRKNQDLSSSRGSGGDFDDNIRKRLRDRDRQNRRNKDKNNPMDIPPPPPNQRYDQATWNNPNSIMNEVPKLLTPEESMNRKYGYAIMALAVVVLAVLMVATIFCCNSSNSTMSQAANPNVNQYDTYSIYSYKDGMVGDTLRSTGTLGGMSLHTETLKSVQSRASPQYRVSDIDPEYARRFKDNQY